MDSRTESRPRHPGFPWFPVIITLVGLAAVAAIQSWPELERNLQGWLTAGVLLLTGVFIFLWFLMSSRFAGRTRLAGFIVVVLAVGAAALNVRVDGTADGRGLPRLVWKGSLGSEAASAWKTPAKAGSANAAATAPGDPRLNGVRDVMEFFGDGRSGRVSGANLAADWAATPPRELWRQPVGLGWSAFAVSGGRAFTQEQREGEEMVTCYDLLTGNLLWTHGDPVRFSQWQSGDGPHATPALNEGKVYAYGATGLLTCLEAETGKKLWQRSDRKSVV